MFDVTYFMLFIAETNKNKERKTRHQKSNVDNDTEAHNTSAVDIMTIAGHCNEIATFS